MAYAIIGAALMLYFSAGGHGSYKPPAVLFAWGLVPWQLELVPGWVGLIALPLAYLLLVFLGSACVVRLGGLRAYAVVPAVHAAGTLVALVLPERESLPRDLPANAALALPLVAVVTFFVADLLGLRAVVSRERAASSDEA